MKLKMVVVDVELTRGQKRLAACGLAGLLVAVGASVALAAPLKTFSANETLTAADLNGNFAELKSKTVIATDWQAYDVKVSANGTQIPVATDDASTSTGFWRRVGDTIEARIDVVTTSCPTGAIGLAATLPTGLKLDPLKSGEYADLGGGIAVKSQGGPIEYTHVIGCTIGSPCDMVGLAAYETSYLVTCANLGAGGQLRVHFSAPIQGWTSGS